MLGRLYALTAPSSQGSPGGHGHRCSFITSSVAVGGTQHPNLFNAGGDIYDHKHRSTPIVGTALPGYTLPTHDL